MTAELIKNRADEEFVSIVEPHMTSSPSGTKPLSDASFKGVSSAINKTKDPLLAEKTTAVSSEVACPSNQYLQMDNLRGLAESIALNLTDILTSLTGEAVLECGGGSGLNATALEIKKVPSAILRMRCLIRKLEHFCGKYQAEHRQVRIATIVEAFLKHFNSHIPANINVTLGISNDLPMVSADPILIRKLLCALCQHAIGAMGQTAGTLRITLAADPQDIRTCAGQANGSMSSCVRLTVEDTGPGIPPCDHQRIFTPFFSRQGNKQLRGTGLSDVYGIVHCMGGRIYIKSKSGCGTAIEILFPATKIDGDQCHAQ